MRTLSSTALALSMALAVAQAAHGQAQAPDAKGKAATKATAQAAPATAPSAAPASPSGAQGRDLFPTAYFDALMKERLAMGQPDNPQVRESVREELNTRELVVREAKRKGMEKDPALRAQMELSSQTILVRAYLQDYLRLHPISDDMLRKEYEAVKGQMGDKEYKARHILVDKQDEAKEIITALQKGEKFDKLAERSKDTGSKANGGDLGWSAPANFVKPFSDAMTGLQKGKFTPQPVQTQFGWHVIQLDDVREAKIPSFEEVRPQLMQRVQPKIVDEHLRDLRAKANVK